MKKDIIHITELNHPVELVWEYLTDSRCISEWLAENNFKPEMGYEFQFKTKPKVKVGFDGNIYCRILELEPFQKLSYSWKGGPGNGKITLDSVVTWMLEPTENGTRLTLEHRGFKGVRNYLTYLIMNKGWSLILKKRLPVKLKAYQHETI
jgi:uncharacterized protein YndB with AHSA1/START domain